MKVWPLHAIGDIRLETREMPVAAPGEVLLKVRACGICGSDIPRVFTKGTYSFPTVPGHEFSGEIVGVAEGGDKSLIGRGAAVFPLMPCRSCSACEIGEFALCENYNYMGSRCDGAFVEYIAVPLWNLLLIPEGVSYEEAAMVEPAAVALHSLRQASVGIGDHVLIYGAGPIGIMIAMWADIWGAGSILLVDVDEDRLSFARGLGIMNTCNSAKTDIVAWVSEQTNGRGADVTIEGAGSSISFENAMHTTRRFGKIVLLGNPAGDMVLTQKGYWEILRKNLTLIGSWNSYYATLPVNEWQLVLNFIASGKLRLDPLITHRVKIEELGDALKMMRDRSEFTVKVMYVNQ
ncbi:galactitol-1-phosphate 5-dehydrogenase [Paenibacillus nasutitermitis]|uniref:galactitol-1-phosphate 5-dehydrogenase n=1 Tax=Paenibacillus nasutitermitis TaxID=1652958 RepID=UPI001664B312|nr:galactitol-1-phosphate 5-dehydrogenase [Paenibacillus nasutitermitis]